MHSSVQSLGGRPLTSYAVAGRSRPKEWSQLPVRQGRLGEKKVSRRGARRDESGVVVLVLLVYDVEANLHQLEYSWLGQTVDHLTAYTFAIDKVRLL